MDTPRSDVVPRAVIVGAGFGGLQAGHQRQRIQMERCRHGAVIRWRGHRHWMTTKGGCHRMPPRCRSKPHSGASYLSFYQLGNALNSTQSRLILRRVRRAWVRGVHLLSQISWHASASRDVSVALTRVLAVSKLKDSPPIAL